MSLKEDKLINITSSKHMNTTNILNMALATLISKQLINILERPNELSVKKIFKLIAIMSVDELRKIIICVIKKMFNLLTTKTYINTLINNVNGNDNGGVCKNSGNNSDSSDSSDSSDNNGQITKYVDHSKINKIKPYSIKLKLNTTMANATNLISHVKFNDIKEILLTNISTKLSFDKGNANIKSNCKIKLKLKSTTFNESELYDKFYERIKDIIIY